MLAKHTRTHSQIIILLSPLCILIRMHLYLEWLSTVVCTHTPTRIRIRTYIHTYTHTPPSHTPWSYQQHAWCLWSVYTICCTHIHTHSRLHAYSSVHQLPISTVHMRRWKLRYYGVDHTLHCRPRAAARIHRVNSDVLSQRIYHQTMIKNKPRLSLRSWCFAPFAQECVSMAPRPWHPRLCTWHNNREPSELVGECTFYALQARTWTILL